MPAASLLSQEIRSGSQAVKAARWNDASRTRSTRMKVAAGVSASARS